MKRKIIEINEPRCNGCGECVMACHEGAIEMVGGKARLVADKYCDGLGDCLPVCPVGAIEIIEREAEPFSEKAIQEQGRKRNRAGFVTAGKILSCGCAGSAERKVSSGSCSVLGQWPIQIKLVNSDAGFLNGADLLVAADCTAYARVGFHEEFMMGRVTLIGCPKLDNLLYYKEKLKEMLRRNNVSSVSVVRMEVPCCGGLAAVVKEAMLESKTIVPYSEVVVTIDGRII